MGEDRRGDAGVALIAAGGVAGAGVAAVDEARERGVRAGLVKLRAIRPFPAARLRAALSGVRAFCVVDRSVSFGWNCGPMFVEARAALGGVGERACFSAIGGLGGADISVADFSSAIARLDGIKDAPGVYDTLWFMKD